MRGVLAAMVLAGALGAAPAEAMEIHAHRGGSVINGVPTYPENTLPAFANAAANGWVLELDAQLTADGKAVVIHDATVDRTTTCTGRVSYYTLAVLQTYCKSDVLGSPGSAAGGVYSPSPSVTVPSLKQVLDLAKATGAKLNVEIKNVPTDPGFDPLGRVAKAVAKELAAANLAPGQLMIQAFWPLDLDIAALYLPGVPQAFLSLGQLNEAAVLYAVARCFEILSPQWPTSNVAINLAHQLGRPLVPYTLDTPATVAAAQAAGVDGLITNDPAMAEAAHVP
jgi:glycerophosphoryl diester phosphodiesterase